MKRHIAFVAEKAAAVTRFATVGRAAFGSVIDGERERRSTARRRSAAAAVIAAVIALVTGVALATPGSGTSPTPVARAAFVDPVDFRLSIRDGQRGRDNIHVRNATDTVMQQIRFGPGAISGWHSHPGPAMILIKSGELMFYSEDDPSCTGRTFSAGQAFIEAPGLVHFAHNPSLTQVTEVGVIYFDVPPDLASPRIDELAPGNCPF